MGISYSSKAYGENVHTKCTGQSNKRILENLSYLDEKGCKIKIRIPYVSEWDSGEIEQMAKLLSKMKNITKIRVLPYYNYAGSK